MKSLDEIIDLFKELRIQKKLINLTDDMLFDKAITLFISERINESKDKRVETMSAQKENKDEPITDKQKTLLKKLDYRGSLNITKAEARKILKDYFKKEEDKYGRGTSKKYRDY